MALKFYVQLDVTVMDTKEAAFDNLQQQAALLLHKVNGFELRLQNLIAKTEEQKNNSAEDDLRRQLNDLRNQRQKITLDLDGLNNLVHGNTDRINRIYTDNKKGSLSSISSQNGNVATTENRSYDNVDQIRNTVEMLLNEKVKAIEVQHNNGAIQNSTLPDQGRTYLINEENLKDIVENKLKEIYQMNRSEEDAYRNEKNKQHEHVRSELQKLEGNYNRIFTTKCMENSKMLDSSSNNANDYSVGPQPVASVTPQDYFYNKTDTVDNMLPMAQSPSVKGECDKIIQNIMLPMIIEQTDRKVEEQCRKLSDRITSIEMLPLQGYANSEHEKLEELGNRVAQIERGATHNYAIASDVEGLKHIIKNEILNVLGILKDFQAKLKIPEDNENNKYSENSMPSIEGGRGYQQTHTSDITGQLNYSPAPNSPPAGTASLQQLEANIKRHRTEFMQIVTSAKDAAYTVETLATVIGELQEEIKRLKLRKGHDGKTGESGKDIGENSLSEMLNERLAALYNLVQELLRKQHDTGTQLLSYESSTPKVQSNSTYNNDYRRGRVSLADSVDVLTNMFAVIRDIHSEVQNVKQPTFNTKDNNEYGTNATYAMKEKTLLDQLKQNVSQSVEAITHEHNYIMQQLSKNNSDTATPSKANAELQYEIGSLRDVLKREVLNLIRILEEVEVQVNRSKVYGSGNDRSVDMENKIKSYVTSNNVKIQQNEAAIQEQHDTMRKTLDKLTAVMELGENISVNAEITQLKLDLNQLRESMKTNEHNLREESFKNSGKNMASYGDSKSPENNAATIEVGYLIGMVNSAD